MSNKRKIILITGSTDGIGLVTAKQLVADGHQVLLHGRNPAKLENVKKALGGDVESYVADLSCLKDVVTLAEAVADKHATLDVLINNAGVFRIADPISDEGLDARFVVNTIAPYLLTQRLLPLMNANGRVINLSSAAQAPVDPSELMGPSRRDDGQVYAQSKLAITMWSHQLAQKLSDADPAIIAVNPRSFLGSKMVKEAYGMDGGDLSIGADILCRAALSDEFAHASGTYFDNDSGRFASPHPDALNPTKCKALIDAVETVIARIIK